MQITVLIAGLGLIGGSIAESIRKEHPGIKIVGFDTDRKTLGEAMQRGIIEETATSLQEGARDADWIILCAPVSAILSMIEQLSTANLKHDVIVTDVGSTKRYIMLQADHYLRGKCHFIGGHPMAGSHKSGVSAAKADLFENAYYFLVQAADQEEAPVQKLEDLLKGTHAKFFRVTPETHDKIVGIISHFPHLIAASLVLHLANHPIEGANLRMLAAGGFRDITRIASSDPTMWADIVTYNRDYLLTLLDEWTNEMEGLKEMLMDGNRKAFHNFFKQAKLFRDGFPKKEKGAIPGFYDLYIDVPDKPEVISKVTGYIGREGVNLTNLEIIEARENVSGVMRLSFQDAGGREKARHILQKNGYHTYLND
ncbi:prephenate dehydrogenase [Sporolactobacillus sp. THM7-4]|nr:prephenate dehydrogenase [Sporolactobacillus sp. THM7-4]